MIIVEKKLLQEVRDEEPVYSEFVSLISLWCLVLMFPKYRVWKNVVMAKLPTIVLFLVENSPAKINCLLACLYVCKMAEGEKADYWFIQARCHEGAGGGHVKLCEETIFRESRNSTSTRKSLANSQTSVTFYYI